MFGFFSQNNTTDINTEYGLCGLDFFILGATALFFTAVYQVLKQVLEENHYFSGGPSHPRTFIMESLSVPALPPKPW